MTIREIAEKAGVSTATVSRLINENGFVSEEARQKILKVFKETGYDPSQRKRRKNIGPPLRLKHSNVVMIWTVGKYYEQSPTGQNLMMGVNEALQKVGASLTVTHIYANEDIPLSLLNGKFDGVLITGTTPSPTVCSFLKKIPTVWLLQQGSADFGDRVQPNHALAGELSCDWLVRQGCRNLCCMSYNQLTAQHNYTQTRADNFLNCASQNDIPGVLLTQPEPEESAGILAARAAAAANLVRHFTRLNPRPDGLFIANELGSFVHSELLQSGIVPMKDVHMVAGDDNICSQHLLDPKPTTIRIFSRQIGQQAVEMLLQRIKNPDMPQLTCALKPQLIIPNAQNLKKPEQ
jgi:LacI family transcriptional regulator